MTGRARLYLTKFMFCSFTESSFEAIVSLVESRHSGPTFQAEKDAAWLSHSQNRSPKVSKTSGKRFQKSQNYLMSNDRVRFAQFELDKGRRRLYRDGEQVQIYAKAFDLLEFLIGHNGDVVTKDEILSRVWPDQFVEEANLSVQISALRKALGETKNEPRFLVTVPGVGYKFVGDIHTGRESEVVSEGQMLERATVDVDIERAETPGTALPWNTTSSLSKWLAVLAGVAVIAGIGYFAYRYFIADTPRIASVAVLPFANQDDSPDTEYLSEGLADSVIHTLSAVPDLRVMSRNSSFRYRSDSTDAKVIGTELGVDSILNGRIATVGDSLSIRAELISTADNSVIWGEQFTRKFADVERFQADIAQAIAKQLRVRVSGLEARTSDSVRTVDPEVYRLTLLGRYHLNKLTDDGFWKGRDHFQKAVELDPEYAPAHAGLAEAYNRLSGWNAIPPHEGFPKARAEAERAIALDGQLSGAHGTLGMVKHFYDWDWPGAENEFKRAIEISANDADVRQYYSYHLSAVGRFDESLAMMKQALELDPLSLDKNAGIGEIYYLGRQYDKALEHYSRTLEMDAASGFLHWAIGNVYARKGMYADAIAAYEKSIPLSGDSPDERLSLANVLALSGKQQEARAILQDLEQRSSKQYISPAALAVPYAALGDKQQAFSLLEKAYERRDMLLVLLKADPMFDGLRDDPRFADLVRRVGLP